MKRGNQAGSVYESPRGSGRWFAQLPPGPDGRRPRRGPLDTKAEAERALRALHAEREDGRDFSKRAQTVAELLDAHLDAVAGQVEGSTLQGYRVRASQVARRIGRMRIDAVTFETVQKVANDMARELSPGYVRQALETLHRAYEMVIPERVARNPVNWRKLHLRSARSTERKPPADDQVRTLLLAADDLDARGGDARYGVAWWLAALLGLRRGELAALTWRDVDFQRMTITVRANLKPDGLGGYIVGKPKTTESARTIPMGARLAARLREHWELHQAERRARGARWKEHGAVLADESGAPLRSPITLNAIMRRLCRDTGIECTPHALRHACATLLAEEGYGETLIASILGHGKPASITSRYIHPSERVRRAAVEAVEARILGETAISMVEAR